MIRRATGGLTVPIGAGTSLTGLMLLALSSVEALAPAAVSARVVMPPRDTIRIAAPAGRSDVDRARVQAAFDRVQPGDTILFSAGTYMLGRGAVLTVPDVTVLGHEDGTVIKGCDPEQLAIPEGPVMENLLPIVMGCTGFFVFADRQTIRGLTFEDTWHGLFIGVPPWFPLSPGETAPDTSYGGHRIEHNVFRNVPNGIRVVGPSDEVTLIRDNEAINAYHAFQAEGATVHVVNNWIRVPSPQSVPASYYPESGIILSPGPSMSPCEGSRVIGNVIDGTVNGIQIRTDVGENCTNHEIRDNVVRVRRIPLPPNYPQHLMVIYFGEGAEGTAVTGTAIRLDADSSATITNVLIQSNRILGGDGLGIQLARASSNRVVDNYISRMRRRSPFPGLTWGEDPNRWRQANGSAIWISEGSEYNQVEGNTFNDVQGPAIHIDGDNNDVRLDTGATVRDEGRDNRVRISPSGSEDAKS